MASFYYRPLPSGTILSGSLNAQREQTLAWSLIKFIEAEGLSLYRVRDDEETFRVDTAEDAFLIVNELEDCRVVFKGSDGTNVWVRLVFGNAWDELICDHSISKSGYFERMMDKVYEHLNSRAPCIPSVAKRVSA
jgi:hypothetical protein